MDHSVSATTTPGSASRAGYAPPWEISIGDGPIIATAIHAGHEVRPDVRQWLEIQEDQRLREEDPLTGIWTSIGDSSVRVFRSRFEVDLNRPRNKAVPAVPEDTWGIRVWRQPLPEPVRDRSLAEYDDFYRDVGRLIEQLCERWNSLLVLDLHSYNHRRGGPDGEESCFLENPEINIGTGTMDRAYWASLVDIFIDALRGQHFRGRALDVRENVKFEGGHFPQWLHEKFPAKVCVLAVEMKKIFMDEWAGTASIPAVEDLRIALRNAARASCAELARTR